MRSKDLHSPKICGAESTSSASRSKRERRVTKTGGLLGFTGGRIFDFGFLSALVEESTADAGAGPAGPCAAQSLTITPEIPLERKTNQRQKNKIPISMTESHGTKGNRHPAMSAANQEYRQLEGVEALHQVP